MQRSHTARPARSAAPPSPSRPGAPARRAANAFEPAAADADAQLARAERWGHDLAPLAAPAPVDARAAPVQRFLESLRRNYLPTWLGGYTPAQVRKKERQEKQEALASSIRAKQQKPKTGLERLEDLRHELRGQKGKLGSRDKLLLQVMNEVVPPAVLSGKVKIADVPGLDREGQTTRKSGGHLVELKPRSELDDPDRYDSTLLHELTHATVDQTYRRNREKGSVFLNLPKYRNQEVEVQERSQFSHAASNRASDILDNLEDDDLVPQEAHAHINKQLEYLGGKAQDETDTVLNEMLLYLRNKKVPEHSPTSRALEGWARERYAARQKERNPNPQKKKK